MSNHRWLHKRGRVYYLRALVPSALVPFVGKKEIWKSLRTSSKPEAMQRVRPIAKEVGELFARARQSRESLLTATRPVRRRRIAQAGFQSGEEALAHDLMVVHDKWGKKPPTATVDAASFYQALTTLAQAFPNARVSEVVEAVETARAERERTISIPSPVLRIVSPDDSA